MWAYRMTEPGRMARVDVADDDGALGEGEVRLRTRVAGICGSDMPRFNGVIGQFERSFDGGAAPAHEIVGDVVESRCDTLAIGDRVVGSLGMSGALAEFVRVAGSALFVVPNEFDDVEAVVIQPVATILRAAALFPSTEGARAAVIGVGPIGLGFCHVLSHRGVSRLDAIDPIERRTTALAYGADDFVQTTAASWRSGLVEAERPNLIVEAVGHQQGTIAEAIHAVADHGYVYGFGTPDDADYRLPYETIYKKDLTLASGLTTDWPSALRRSADYLSAYRKDFAGYVSHRAGIADAQEAYALYAHPQADRLKVVVINE
jgi:threonine dehydrogenase-like Zn-dependent dehydrogenase